MEMETIDKTKQTILFLKGLPGSGKTTYAIDYLKNNPNFKRVNKDDIRSNLKDYKFTKKIEKEVLDIERKTGINYLRHGFNLIVDDTNFNPIHEEYWRNIADTGDYNFIIKYIDTPLKECIKRDKERETTIGERVIKQMYNKYVKSNITTDSRLILEQDKTLPKCIICDIDGTLALINGREVFDNTKVYTDKVNIPVANILYDYVKLGVKVIYLSGRMVTSRDVTIQWLRDNNLWFENQSIYMRREGDYRKDSIVKKELYEKFVKDKYYIKFVLDDRNQVVDMWREEGLLCLQVYYGDF